MTKVVIFLLLSWILLGCTQLEIAENKPEEFEQLEAAFLYAVRAIQSSQSEEGYWITSHTKSTIFSEPKEEINVWVPAIMVDLLAPVVQETGLDETLEQARAYLTGQVEATGLVRYHGTDPDKVIIPDSDDTTLVWRIAPPDDTRVIGNVFSTLEQFQTQEGLYRIWLIPEGSPGHPVVGDDPNPIDIVVSIHVYQFLAIYSPNAADKLCQALGENASKPHLWTWYERTPWIYVLREIDLAEAGCYIDRPNDLLVTDIDGQDLYLKLTELIRDLVISEDPSNLRNEILQLLSTISNNDFMIVETSPIILYHSDLSSPISRYYWSKEITYALWLRLYFEAEQRFEDWPAIPHP